MQRLAFRDPLTGLFNRRAFDDRIAPVTDHELLQCTLLMTSSVLSPGYPFAATGVTRRLVSQNLTFMLAVTRLRCLDSIG